jgi:hypothetical protein
MASNDPTETGGLFIGRRPGTAPLRYRETPVVRSAARRRLDSVLAGMVLVLETLVCLTLWGPQEAGWLWVGSQVDHQTGNVVAGILTAFVGMLVTMMATLAIAMRLDRVWKLVRRAGGYEQKRGALERIFVASGAIAAAAFFIWFLVIEGPSPQFSPAGVVTVVF